MEIKEWLADWFYTIFGIIFVIIPCILLGTLIGLLMHPVIGIIYFGLMMAMLAERFKSK